MNSSRLSISNKSISEGSTPFLDVRELNTQTPLRLIKIKEETDPHRPPIQANLFQRLCFYQYQVNSVSKSEFHGSHPKILRSWMLVLVSTTLTLGVVGWFFIIAFLGMFAKEQHLYIIKMVPIGFGMIWIYFFFALIDLSRFLDISMAFLDHFANGIYYKNPWNRCTSIDIELPPKSINGTSYEFQCLNYDDFRKVLLTSGSTDFKMTLIGQFSCFILDKYDKCIQISHTVYLEGRGRELIRLERFGDFFYCFLLLGGCVIACRQIYKKLIWKILLYTDLLYCIVYFIVNAHIVYMPTASQSSKIYKIEPIEDGVVFTIKDLCALLCACYAFSPPSIHFLVSRSENVNPAQESFAMAFSVVIHTLFFILANFSVRNYTIDLMGGLDIGTVFSFPRQYNIMDIWLIYFASMPAGNLLTLLFVTSNFMLEYFSMIISFHCLVEIYVAEFKILKNWVITFITTAGLFMFYYFLDGERSVLQLYGRITIMVLELFFIYIVYSLERLLDDIQFYYGVSPSKMRYLCILASITMELMILFLFFWYVDLDYAGHFLGMDDDTGANNVPYVMVIFVAVPLLFCAAYTTFNIYLKQKDWSMMFVPHTDWGPSNYFPRQLRKLFESRKFIASQAPRVLSRYLLKNSEPDKYKLDIVYDFSSLWRLINSMRD